MMNLLLTSCGLETEAITNAFLKMLPKPPADVRALFIPTAANSPDAIEVLPKCLGDLLKCGVRRENITVYDLHDPMAGALSGQFDAVYLCGGDPNYLLRRVKEQGFDRQLLEWLHEGGVAIGVSAGSMIFDANRLGLLACPLSVHCSDEIRERPGRYPAARQERIRLGNRQAILLETDEMIVME